VSNVLQFPPSKLDRIYNEHRLRGFSKKELSVLSPQIEPFLSGETKEKRARAEWFAQQFHRFYPSGTCHVRGLHYRCVIAGDLLKPNGAVYQNTDKDWWWLSLAATNARWLGLVPTSLSESRISRCPYRLDAEAGRHLQPAVNANKEDKRRQAADSTSAEMAGDIRPRSDRNRRDD